MLSFFWVLFAELSCCVALAGRFIGSMDTKARHGTPEACGDQGRSSDISMIAVTFSIPILITLLLADDDREHAPP